MTNRDDDAPATQADVASVKRAVDEVSARVDRLDADLRSHFELVAENLAADFRATTKDQVEVLKDTLLLHDRRITALEMAK